MRIPNRSKVRLALMIVAGKVSISSFGWKEWDLLGYDPYKFGSMGVPTSEVDVKERAVEILLDAILWMCDDNGPRKRDDQSY